MNRIKNDRGEWVAAIGSENSTERAKVKFPRLISDIEDVRDNRDRYPDEYFSWIDVARECDLHKIPEIDRKPIFEIFGFEDCI